MSATVIHKGNEGGSERGDENAKVSWWMTECSGFSETEIASSAQSNRQIFVRKGCLLLVVLEYPSQRVGDIELVGIPEGSWTAAGSIEHDESAATRHTYLIDTACLDADQIYRASLKISSGVMEERIPVGELRVEGFVAVLPELRQEEIGDMCRQIGPSGLHRLVLVDGEAGVGKTHFVERAAEALRTKYGFDVVSFTVTDEHQGHLLAALLRACLTPSIHQKSFQEVAQAVQKVLLSDELDAGNLEANVGLLARVAIRMGPRVIVLRDCQLLNAQVANQIWALVVALNDAGWGGVRLVLEYRQPDATLNEAIKSLVTKIKLRIRRVLLTKPLVPLTQGELSATAAKIFRHVTPEIAACLMQRTGGLPLFLESYLCRLLDLGFVVWDRGNPPRLSISQPAQVLSDTLPVSGALILEDRMRTWLQKTFGDDANMVATQLGLVAVTDSATSQSFILEALSISPERLRAIQLAVDAGNLGYWRPDGEIVFRHDLLRTAMISVAREDQRFVVSAREIADRLVLAVNKENELQIRYLRARIFSVIADRVALEVELRLGVQAAKEASDYGHLVSFLAQLLALLPKSSNAEERLDLMSGLAWAEWVSDSLLVARQRYLLLAHEAQQIATGDFSFAEAIATDAYRRAIGIDLELMEPLAFLNNAIAVLKRRQTPVTFNSIVNRLVLFCARFGYPQAGFEFSELAFNYIGEGLRENEGAVICSEMGALYAHAEPDTALSLFRQGVDLASDECQRSYNVLDILVLESLHMGGELDLNSFSQLWTTSSQNRFSEVLTRASLLRGSLYLRAGDLVNARQWIERTSTLVNLYHLNEFELPVLNDLLLLSFLEGNLDQARTRLTAFIDEFEKLLEAVERMTRLVPKALNECRDAAKKLAVEQSPLFKPGSPPEYCGVFFEILGNIATIAPRLGMSELALSCLRPELLLPGGSRANGNRYAKCGDLELVLGAY
ncbi:hypothetical protein [Rhodoferax ferrireducens]|uniref:hypothetical protein n=1 Tax=Rhodoferax ferrireducens TaxID=192843 RepID=UPI00130051C6|nr:hypothetical protein [Rhodoferax ferrireducens]